jgi:hypothetical protein
MLFRRALAAIPALLISGAAQAGSLYTSQSAFTAAATGTVVNTTSFGLPYYDPTTPLTTNSITLANGYSVGVSANQVLQAGNGFSPFTNGYSGDILYNTTSSETISFSSGISALGFYIAPDLGLASELGFANNASLTVTLSDGLSTGPISLDNFIAGNAQFFGFAGLDDVTSATITVSGVDGFGNPINAFAIGDFFDVPEPMSAALLGGGVFAVAAARRRVRR